jgi:hypothetical protein
MTQCACSALNDAADRIEALEAAQMILAEALREAIEMMPLDTIEQSLWRDKARAALVK